MYSSEHNFDQLTVPGRTIYTKPLVGYLPKSHPPNDRAMASPGLKLFNERKSTIGLSATLK